MALLVLCVMIYRFGPTNRGAGGTGANLEFLTIFFGAQVVQPVEGGSFFLAISDEHKKTGLGRLGVSHALIPFP